MYLISAYFDDRCHGELNKHIKRLAEITGNDFMVENNVPPHLTIAGIEARSPSELESLYRNICDRFGEGEIIIPTVGVFLPYVIYAAPVLNRYLQEMSAALSDMAEGSPEIRISKYYFCFNWQPHITLAKKLDGEQMKAAFKYLQRYFVPIEGRIVSLGLAKPNPHEDIYITGLRK